MITKFNEWDDTTQQYIRESLTHVVDHDGYVLNLHNHVRISEDTAYDHMEIFKIMGNVNRSDAIETLENIEDLTSEQSFVCSHIIDYLRRGFIEGEK